LPLDILPGVRPTPLFHGEIEMLTAALIVLLIVGMLSTFPVWGHSIDWGFAPCGGCSIALFVVVVLTFLGRI
jgi:hypothetical protein